MRVFYCKTITASVNGKRVATLLREELHYGEVPESKVKKFNDFECFSDICVEIGKYRIDKRVSLLNNQYIYFYSSNKLVQEKNFRHGEIVTRYTISDTEPSFTFEFLMNVLPGDEFLHWVKDTLCKN